MSLVLFLVYWVGVPLLIVFVARGLWRQSKTPVHKGLVAAVSTMILLGLLWLAEGEKWLLDRQVWEMCARDGGVEVYETVKLSAEKFNQYGQPNFYHPNQGEYALGAEYMFKEDILYYKRGNPEFLMEHQKILRRLDGKLLGEGIVYVRRGGGLPGPWPESLYICPARKDMGLVEKIFVSSGEGVKK